MHDIPDTNFKLKKIRTLLTILCLAGRYSKDCGADYIFPTNANNFYSETVPQYSSDPTQTLTDVAASNNTHYMPPYQAQQLINFAAPGLQCPSPYYAYHFNNPFSTSHPENQGNSNRGYFLSANQVLNSNAQNNLSGGNSHTSDSTNQNKSS